jgi:hypothetical protein
MRGHGAFAPDYLRAEAARCDRIGLGGNGSMPLVRSRKLPIEPQVVHPPLWPPDVDLGWLAFCILAPNQMRSSIWHPREGP